ncbi:hypothetical protein BDQ17DRAFT_1491936 [Cyathus striatus]|nr:hypothetical protein BDQ17DRAFT_1491936 [Cyathus striatus]
MSVPAYYRWRGVFTKLHTHPQMNIWLQGNEDISDHEVWKGKTQTQETLKAIRLKFEKQQKIAKKDAKETSEDEESSDNMKSKDKGKGKGKERVRGATEGKEKEKEKRKDEKRKKNRENLNFINILPVTCILSTSPTFSSMDFSGTLLFGFSHFMPLYHLFQKHGHLQYKIHFQK